MANDYNFYNLEAPFRKFLDSGNRKMSSISISNYISDLRHFFGWIVLTIKNRADSPGLASSEFSEVLSKFLTEGTVRDYMAYLRANNIPIRTINRRLSTLRKFCTFCIEQNWIKTNPAKVINNVMELKQKSITKDPLSDFSDYLMKHEEDQSVAKTLIEDIREFFVISSNRD